MWAVHLRLHDPSWRTGLPFFAAAALVLAGDPAAVLGAAGRRRARRPRRRRDPARRGEPDAGGRAAGQARPRVRGEQPAQPVGQGRPGGFVEAGEQRVLGLEQVDQGPVDGRAAVGGELDADRAPVVRVAVAADEAAGDEAVDAVGHRPGGHAGRPDQGAGGGAVGRARAAQRGQHVELPALEPVPAERGGAGAVHVPGQPVDPGEDLHGRGVEVGPFAAPGVDEVVDLVLGGAHAVRLGVVLSTSREAASAAARGTDSALLHRPGGGGG